MWFVKNMQACKVLFLFCYFFDKQTKIIETEKKKKMLSKEKRINKR